MAVILVAIETAEEEWEEAQRVVMRNLPRPSEENGIESWWIAEDVRFDNSDNDSAVFVTMGEQKRAHSILLTHLATNLWNEPRE